METTMATDWERQAHGFERTATLVFLAGLLAMIQWLQIAEIGRFWNLHGKPGHEGFAWSAAASLMITVAAVWRVRSIPAAMAKWAVVLGLACANVFFATQMAATPFVGGEASAMDRMALTAIEDQIESLDVHIAERRSAMEIFDPVKYRTRRAELMAGIEPLLHERGRLAGELRDMTRSIGVPPSGLAGLFRRGSVLATLIVRALLELGAILLLAMLISHWGQFVEALRRPVGVGSVHRDEYAQAVHDAGRDHLPDATKMIPSEDLEVFPGLELDREDEEDEDEVEAFVFHGSARGIVMDAHPNAICASMNEAQPKQGPFAVWTDQRRSRELGRGGSPSKAWIDAAGAFVASRRTMGKIFTTAAAILMAMGAAETHAGTAGEIASSEAWRFPYMLILCFGAIICAKLSAIREERPIIIAAFVAVAFVAGVFAVRHVPEAHGFGNFFESAGNRAIREAEADRIRMSSELERLRATLDAERQRALLRAASPAAPVGRRDAAGPGTAVFLLLFAVAALGAGMAFYYMRQSERAQEDIRRIAFRLDIAERRAGIERFSALESRGGVGEARRMIGGA